MPPPDTSSNPAAGLKTILIIDDDVQLVATLALSVEKSGYRALSASDATAGWNLARAHLPDLILCDIQMPGKDGPRLLQEMRADPELADRQFVLMTGKLAHGSPRAAMDLGADDLLLKPFSLTDLLNCIAARLQRAAISRRVDDRVLERLQASLHANLPRELFTPLAGILGLTEVLENQLDIVSKEEIRQDLRDIRLAGRRLHRTLRNYLLILELDTAKIARPSALLGEKTILAALSTGIKAAAERHQRPADVMVDLTSAKIEADPADLAILAEELVDNALSFSRRESKVHVRAWEEGNRLNFSVTDTGRGMTPEQLAQVGTLRSPGREESGQPGLGLGLALVRKLVRHLGGEFRLESQDGKGTTSHFSLPIPAA
ncbi:MAG: ATP-binding protein [Opitutaceae bacterium]|nr:ATP-binding protein [Opitutaceae bacterium]